MTRPTPHGATLPQAIRDQVATILTPAEMNALEMLFLLRTTTQAIDLTVSRWLEPEGLSLARWQVMIVIWGAGKAVPQRDIVDALRLTRATISTLVEGLLSDGYLQVIGDAADRRRQLISLTEKGRETTVRLVETNGARLHKAFRRIKRNMPIIEKSLLDIDLGQTD